MGKSNISGGKTATIDSLVNGVIEEYEGYDNINIGDFVEEKIFTPSQKSFVSSQLYSGSNFKKISDTKALSVSAQNNSAYLILIEFSSSECIEVVSTTVLQTWSYTNYSNNYSGGKHDIAVFRRIYNIYFSC